MPGRNNKRTALTKKVKMNLDCAFNETIQQVYLFVQHLMNQFSKCVCLFSVNNGNVRAIPEICSNLILSIT